MAIRVKVSCGYQKKRVMTQSQGAIWSESRGHLVRVKGSFFGNVCFFP